MQCSNIRRHCCGDRNQTEQSILEGRDGSGRYSYTDVFVERDGHWKVVATETKRVRSQSASSNPSARDRLCSARGGWFQTAHSVQTDRLNLSPSTGLTPSGTSCTTRPDTCASPSPIQILHIGRTQRSLETL